MSRQVDLTEQVTALDSQIDVVTELGYLTLGCTLRPCGPFTSVVLAAVMDVVPVRHGVLSDPTGVTGLDADIPPITAGR